MNIFRNKEYIQNKIMFKETLSKMGLKLYETKTPSKTLKKLNLNKNVMLKVSVILKYHYLVQT